MSSASASASAFRRRKLFESSHSWGASLPVIILSPDDNTPTGGGESGEILRYSNDDGGNMSNEMDDHHDEHSSSSSTYHSHEHNMSIPSQGGTIMYMDGFHSALFPSSPTSSPSPPPPCLNLFYPSWTLHTPTRFVLAMILITLMGILVEACGAWRIKYLRRGRSCRRRIIRLKRLQVLEEEQQQRQLHPGLLVGDDVALHAIPGATFSTTPATTTTTTTLPTSQSSFHLLVCPAIIRRMWQSIIPECVRIIFAKMCCCCYYCCFAMSSTRNDGMSMMRAAAKRYEIFAACLHALRAWLGYLLMLAVMTYAVEFLVSAVFGMVLGRYWLVKMEEDEDEEVGDGGPSGVDVRTRGISGMIDGMWGGGDPCCGIDDDNEEDEFHDTRDDDVIGASLSEPLLSSPLGNNNGRVTHRRNVVGQQTESDA